MRTLLAALALALLLSSPADAVTLAIDGFNRADENPLAGNWTLAPANPGNLKIVGNRVQGAVTSNRNAAYYNAVSAPNDQWSQLTMTTAVGDRGACTLVRQSAVADSNYYFCPYDSGGDVTELGKRVAGTFTTFAANLNAWAPGNTNRIEAQGTTIRGYIAGVLIETATDASLASGQFGIQIDSSGTLSDVEADDWSGGDFTSAPAPRRHSIINLP